MPEREAVVAAARNGAIAASKLSEFGGREVLLKALWLRRSGSEWSTVSSSANTVELQPGSAYPMYFRIAINNKYIFREPCLGAEEVLGCP